MQIPYTFVPIELNEIIIILCEGDIDELDDIYIKINLGKLVSMILRIVH
jgi:hypothetical protein